MVLQGPVCKLPRREPVKARMWSDGVVVEPPLFDDLACLAVAGKEMLVQAFIVQT